MMSGIAICLEIPFGFHDLPNGKVFLHQVEPVNHCFSTSPIGPSPYFSPRHNEMKKNPATNAIGIRGCGAVASGSLNTAL